MAKKSGKKASKKKRESRKAAKGKKVVKARSAKKAAKKRAVKKKAAAKRPVAKRANRVPRPPHPDLDLSAALVNTSHTASLADHVFALASAGQINARVRTFLIRGTPPAPGWIPDNIGTDNFSLSDPVAPTFKDFQTLLNMMSQLAGLLEPSNLLFERAMGNDATPLLNEINVPGRTIGYFVQRVCYYARKASGLED